MAESGRRKPDRLPPRSRAAGAIETGMRVPRRHRNGIRLRKSGSHQTPRWREQDSNPRSPSTVSSLHPRARHDPRRHREARNADSFASTSSPCDLQHAWGAFHMDRALSSRSASDGFEHLAASFSPSRASFEICRGDRRPNEAPTFRFCGVGVDWTPQ
jgi:hypothetical protein